MHIWAVFFKSVREGVKAKKIHVANLELAELETFNEIAVLIMQRDDRHSDQEIAAIETSMECARFTQEGLQKKKSEIQFYQSRKDLNEIIVASGNESLVRTNAIKILHRIISEAEIPSSRQGEEMEAFRKLVQEYSRYLEILSEG